MYLNLSGFLKVKKLRRLKVEFHKSPFSSFKISCLMIRSLLMTLLRDIARIGAKGTHVDPNHVSTRFLEL